LGWSASHRAVTRVNAQVASRAIPGGRALQVRAKAAGTAPLWLRRRPSGGVVAISEGKTRVIGLDLKAYFDNVKHHILLKKVAERVQDRDVRHGSPQKALPVR
jgi:hypothetical protein